MLAFLLKYGPVSETGAVDSLVEPAYTPSAQIGCGVSF